MEPQFLQGEDHVVKAASINDVCQFTYDYSWYNFIPTTDITTPTYYESKGDTGVNANAYFTYCQNLDNTDVPACSTSAWASVFVNDACALNADSITPGIMTVNDVETFALVYSNSGSNNNGVTELTVGQQCDDSATTVTTYGLSSSNDGTTYSTYQQS